MNARVDIELLGAAASEVEARITAIDWDQIERSVESVGSAVMPRLITPGECVALAALYPDESTFRSRIVMARHGFGRGEYKYFCYPLPAVIAEMRPLLYARLREVANRWNEAMGIDI